MLHIILYQPEIPPNTGNIIRLAANTGCTLHLIRPLGFTLDDKRLRRAGLDYKALSHVVVHDDLDSCLLNVKPPHIWACSTKGHTSHTEANYQINDALLFGPETRGLPDSILTRPAPVQIIRIPMQAHSRSLNLSNAVAIVVYEAWRQLGFTGIK